MRKKKGITWKFLNENIPGKVYSSRMTELKNGKTALSGEQLIVVAKILETSTDYLLGNTDDPSLEGQKKPALDFESGLTDPLDIQLMNELPGLTSDQKELLLAQILVLKGKK